jgi:RecB family exonuclease
VHLQQSKKHRFLSTFIQQLVAEIIEKHGDRLDSLCVVFPTRRAGLFFRKELAAQVKNPVWSPKIFSIQDFLLRLSGRNLADQLTLLFDLFRVYNQYFPAEDFARFYSWGELMLSDFDEIDKYLVSAPKIFETVTDLHKIDQQFALEEEDLEHLKQFWKNFFDRDPSLLRNEFLNTWKHLGNIYSSFRKILLAKNVAYEGMAYRELADNLTSGKKKNTEFTHIVFGGFYVLTPAEQSVVTHLVEAKEASVYWDADSYYADDEIQEAGKFFRSNKIAQGKFKWKHDHFATVKKEIEVAGIPLMVGQAKYAGNILQSLMKENGFDPSRTAVVLPDEKLLFPVLYSLPAELPDINVTMGYPLHQTPLFNLFESLIILQRNARPEKDDVSFYYRDVLNILNHPYIRLIADKFIRRWQSDMSETFIRIPGTRLVSGETHDLFRQLFVRLSTVSGVFEWYRSLLHQILMAMKENDFKFHRLESEFVYYFYTNLVRLEDLMKDSIVTDIETFWRIFREVLTSVRVPFTGEPLKGLQVMGFLETRVLDFDNIIVLSVNEDVLPSSRNKPSYIPFSIRKAFGLPTYEEQNAVSAYHFYRLMQRAKKVFLIHNTESKGLTTGEQSRFLLQIENELVRKFPANISIQHKVISTRITKDKIEELVVEKTEPVMDRLSRFISNGQAATSFISASLLNSYIACQLRFYFQYVAGLAEPDETEDTIEAALLGRILHKAMQYIYTGIDEIDNDTVFALKKKINDVVDKAIHEEFVSINQLEGKNILMRNILRELVSRIIDEDKRSVPLRILQLEKDVRQSFKLSDGKGVELKGIIDRVDERKGLLRIIDYKTGKLDRKKGEIADYFTDPALKEQFQATYYAFLTHRAIPGRSIMSGLFAMRSMGEGIWFLNKGESFSEEQFSEFEKHLDELIQKIFSPEIPFTQTQDEKQCLYCAFKAICNR